MAGLDFSAVESALAAVGKGGDGHDGAVTRLLQALVQSIKAANHFPTDESGDAILFSNHANFSQDSKDLAQRLMVVLEELMEQVRVNASETPATSSQPLFGPAGAKGRRALCHGSSSCGSLRSVQF